LGRLLEAVRKARGKEASKAAEALDAVKPPEAAAEIWGKHWTKIRDLLYSFDYTEAAAEISALLAALTPEREQLTNEQ